MPRKEIETEVMDSNERVADYLETIARGLRDKALYIEQGDKKIALTPSEAIKLEMKAKSKDDKEKVTLKLSWKPTPEILEGESTLKVSTEKPEVVEREENVGEVLETENPVELPGEAAYSPSDDESENEEEESGKKGKNEKESGNKKEGKK